ncbi:hypothetical protein BU17DRAFT_87837 [Hysterangium stoloniferum]|nr:hypothetical protein BU17DRAFT_87837 [Hysterangium stoloniferum]
MFAKPLIDTRNPLYCPEDSPNQYIQRLQKFRTSSQRGLDSFTRRLCDTNSWIQETSLNNPSPFGTDRQLPEPQSLKHKITSDLASSSLDFQHVRKRARSDSDQYSSFVVTPSQYHPCLQKVLDEFPLQDDSSEVALEKLLPPLPAVAKPSASPTRLLRLDNELYGHPIGAETPRAISRLLSDLSHELPGILLKSRLSRFQNITHQVIVDILGLDGYLARHILGYFRRSSIERLNLSNSLIAADGLNELCPSIVLDIFSLPNSFTKLTCLNLNGVYLDDFDLTRIHHLPSLSILHLNNTCIGNEALVSKPLIFSHRLVFFRIGHLTSLKHQLTELHTENNPRVTDDCIPSLCLFPLLLLLRIFGTGIQMPGLRKLASSIRSASREVDIDIPKDCETYLNSLHAQYHLHPVAPMITDPLACPHLSLNALKANLAGHAVFNPSIYLSGSKVELIHRLRDILERRQNDRIVKEVVWGHDSSEDGEGEGEGSEEAKETVSEGSG